jgi:Cof subfamily protein (haloacid dehalogenase superfamily)
VDAFVCDLDRTLIGEDAVLRPRTLAAIAAARGAGSRVILATGRMFRAVRPYLEQAELRDPVVCYQGAAVVDPSTGTFLLHEPLDLELAREAIALLEQAGHPPNCYVGDQLFVARQTSYSRAYADFQDIRVTEVGDLLAWITQAPTKLVAVGEPDELAKLRVPLADRLGPGAFVTTSLPFLLEVGNATVSKGTGAAWVSERLGFAAERSVAFGDGENDLELLEWSGYGIAVESAHVLLRERADWICPGPEEEGVAAVIQAFVDSRP